MTEMTKRFMAAYWDTKQMWNQIKDQIFWSILNISYEHSDTGKSIECKSNTNFCAPQMQ